jgi:hypothetical protein
MGKEMMKGGGRTFAKVVGRAGQLQGCPLAPGAMVEPAPHTLAHIRTVAFIPQGQKEVAQGRIASMSTPSFHATEGDKFVQGDDVEDFGGNL